MHKQQLNFEHYVHKSAVGVYYSSAVAAYCLLSVQHEETKTLQHIRNFTTFVTRLLCAVSPKL